MKSSVGSETTVHLGQPGNRSGVPSCGRPLDDKLPMTFRGKVPSSTDFLMPAHDPAAGPGWAGSSSTSVSGAGPGLAHGHPRARTRRERLVDGLRRGRGRRRPGAGPVRNVADRRDEPAAPAGEGVARRPVGAPRPRTAHGGRLPAPAPVAPRAGRPCAHAGWPEPLLLGPRQRGEVTLDPVRRVPASAAPCPVRLPGSSGEVLACADDERDRQPSSVAQGRRSRR